MVEQRWYSLDDAPINETGHLWSPDMPDRVDALGWVYVYADGERGTSSNFRGVKMTHWHPLPEPPVVS